jgi:hypothetical protein
LVEGRALDGLEFLAQHLVREELASIGERRL